MPSSEPLPTIPEFLRAFEGETSSRREETDTHRGAMYDHWSGVGAILFRRIAERDRDEFRQNYFNSAENEALDQIVEQRFGGARVLTAHGVGTVALARASAAAGAGTFWKGTRIGIGAGVMPVRYYLVSADTPVGASALTALVPIKAAVAGREGYISGTPATLPVIRWEDPLWDNTWAVTAIECAEGTLRQQDHELRAATQQDRIDSRVGYPTAIVAACKAAGAHEVALFPGNWLGAANDHGLNRVYVGDQSYESTPALLKACRLAMPGIAMGGANVQVLGMTRTLLTLTLIVTVWQKPTNPYQQAEWVRDAVVEYFRTRDNPFLWREDGVKAAAVRALSTATSVQLTASASAPTLATLFDTNPLPRYQVEPWTVRVTVQASE